MKFTRTWAEIDLDAIENNYIELKRINADAEVLGIVKADAYGFGAVEVSKKFERLGARYLAVASVSEAVELREAGIKMPIIILGYTPEEYTHVLLENDITQAVGSLESAVRYAYIASSYGKVLKCHLKLDTGMGRLGFDVFSENAIGEIVRTMSLVGLEFEGVFTHFAVSDMADDESSEYTKRQYEAFANIIETVESAMDVKFALKHCSNSGASLDYTDFHMDMIRPGIAIYGTEDCSDANIKQCFKLKSLMGPIKTVPAGSSISYGRLWTAPKDSRIGVLPIGYADGLSRKLSGQLSVMTPYGPAPIVGRICMDACMVDLSDLPECQTGDVIEVIGEYNSVQSIADRISDIPYVVTCGISRRVPRVYLEDGRVVAEEEYV